MRNNIKSDAYITVEATVVVTVIIFLFTFLIYMVIFSYNRTLLSQDTHLMSYYAKEESRSDKDNILKNMSQHFSVVYTERPYLSFTNMSMELSKKSNQIVIRSQGEFITPFTNDILELKSSAVDIKDESYISLSDPVTIMLKTKDITRK